MSDGAGRLVDRLRCALVDPAAGAGVGDQPVARSGAVAIDGPEHVALGLLGLHESLGRVQEGDVQGPGHLDQVAALEVMDLVGQRQQGIGR